MKPAENGVDVEYDDNEAEDDEDDNDSEDREDDNDQNDDDDGDDDDEEDDDDENDNYEVPAWSLIVPRHGSLWALRGESSVKLVFPTILMYSILQYS